MKTIVRTYWETKTYSEIYWKQLLRSWFDVVCTCKTQSANLQQKWTNTVSFATENNAAEQNCELSQIIFNSIAIM